MPRVRVTKHQTDRQSRHEERLVDDLDRAEGPRNLSYVEDRHQHQHRHQPELGAQHRAGRKGCGNERDQARHDAQQGPGLDVVRVVFVQRRNDKGRQGHGRCCDGACQTKGTLSVESWSPGKGREG